jgi:general secretion pathway protein H
MRNKGFTLLELIIVLFIVGMAAAFVAPMVVKSLNNLRLKTATKQLSAVLRYARSKAVSTKNTVQVVLDIDNSSYSAGLPLNNAALGSNTFPQDVSFKLVKTGGEEHSSGLAQLLFYPKGNTSGGEIIIENTNNRLYKITVDILTGKVKINSLNEGEA